MLSTRDWAEALDISPEDNPPIVEESVEYPRTAREIAVRALILQGVVAVAFGVDPGPVVKWFQDQQIWQAVTS